MLLLSSQTLVNALFAGNLRGTIIQELFPNLFWILDKTIPNSPNFATASIDNMVMVVTISMECEGGEETPLTLHDPQCPQ